VSPAWLAARLDRPSVRILDVRVAALPRDGGTKKSTRERGPAPPYRDGHVPGAVPLDVHAQLFDARGDVVTAPELAMTMSALGVGDGDTVVLVDEGRPDRALAAAWALVRYGHRDVHVLEGGHARWVAEGRPVARDVVRHPPASFTAKVQR